MTRWGDVVRVVWWTGVVEWCGGVAWWSGVDEWRGGVAWPTSTDHSLLACGPSGLSPDPLLMCAENIKIMNTF